jgi:hypothetical protein
MKIYSYLMLLILFITACSSTQPPKIVKFKTADTIVKGIKTYLEWEVRMLILLS